MSKQFLISHYLYKQDYKKLRGNIRAELELMTATDLKAVASRYNRQKKSLADDLKLAKSLFEKKSNEVAVISKNISNEIRLIDDALSYIKKLLSKTTRKGVKQRLKTRNL